MRVAFVSSNQGAPEENITDVITAAAMQVLAARGVTVASFHKHGFGLTGDQQLADLRALADSAVAWGPDRLIGFHVDSKGTHGDGRRTGILMCVAKGRKVWADALGKAIAKATSYPFEGTRDSYTGYIIISRPEKHGIKAAILEVSEYSDDDLAELKQRAAELGREAGNAIADDLGAPAAAQQPTQEDDMTEQQAADLAAVRKSTQVQSVRSAITNALLVGNRARAQQLNDEFYASWPEADSGLPVGWKAA